jgi:adenylate cyclase
MKSNLLWLGSIPFILIFSILQLVADFGERGALDSAFLRNQIYPHVLSLNGSLTNLKFKLRGEQPVKNKIVILAADDLSVEQLGRWPWARDVYAHLIYATFQSGAKVMGIDVVFSETQERVHPSVYTVLESAAVSPNTLDLIKKQIKSLEPDPLFAEVVSEYKKKLVLGYTGSPCQPRYAQQPDDCPIHNLQDQKLSSEALAHNQASAIIPLQQNIIDQTSIPYQLAGIFNIPLLTQSSIYSGSFNAIPDPDGYIRRYSTVFVHQNKIHASLALAIAIAGDSKKIQADFDPSANLKSLSLVDPITKTISEVSVSPTGFMQMNFRGSSEQNNFKTIPISNFLSAFEKQTNEYAEIMKDAYVLLGVTSLGLYDMRAFPFNSNSPGVEGHATALDNILSHDELKSAQSIGLGWMPFLWLWIFGLVFAFYFSKLEALPSLGMMSLFLVASGLVDIYFFSKAINWPSALLLIQTLTLFILIQSARYVIEERNRKFIRQAFSFYLAPQIVEYVLKDPTKLTVGGDRRELSILFTDIRGFTTISEGLDPKTLSLFLNEYLTAMTDIIFENGGTLDKYIGDAVMAFWGAPIHDPLHADQATRAAVQMQAKMRELAPIFKQKYNIDVAMGVGVNSGTVSVGNMGSAKIFEYTVIGDHVNLASRLEGLTKTYGTEVLCSRFTLDKLTDEAKKDLNYRVLDWVKVKGKNQAIDLIELTAEPIDAQALELYYLAKDAFKNRNFILAIEHFEKSKARFVDAHQKEDFVCTLFIDRCKLYLKTPPPEGWDGSFEMRQK